MSMETNCQYISYESTGFFSKMMVDYLNGDEKLQPFYKHPVSIDGIKAAIEARKQFATPRQVLVEELRKQYQGIELGAKQEANLQLLLNDNTFTTCTAHQPNIFTGPLYFIYKILHAVKLAEYLKTAMPENNFVPIYYMGSEDADLEELGHINLEGEKLEWQTKQTGAVGRMKVDRQLTDLVDRIAARLDVLEHGKELSGLLRSAYTEQVTIQQATLLLVNQLFKEFGLLVLIPDNAGLKKTFTPVVKKELTEQFSHKLVESTGEQLRQHYKVQAGGRDINLFYLTEDKRERIEKAGEKYEVKSLGLSWSADEIVTEAKEHPESFSANVILRGVFQETILPNIAFIGGGGEIAYWLELKEVFENCNVPFPVLIVRNSFLLVDKKQKELTRKLGFEISDLFKPAIELINALVTRETTLQLTLKDEKEQLQSFYSHLKKVANEVDSTLSDHTAALQTKAFETLTILEKKMLRAEKRKFEDSRRQIQKLKQQLFPGDSLQERKDNFSSFYALYGKDWLQKLYEASLCLEQEFGVLEV